MFTYYILLLKFPKSVCLQHLIEQQGCAQRQGTSHWELESQGLLPTFDRYEWQMPSECVFVGQPGHIAHHHPARWGDGELLAIGS